jgi:hypothetical protein
MGFVKFNFIFLILSLPALAQTLGIQGHSPERFTSKACVDAAYKMTMSQKGPFFGLMKQEFTIDKTGCIINVLQQKYLTKEWVIDVCREPIHIKIKSATGTDVAKKIESCINKEKPKDTSDFCTQYAEIVDVIQDEGLIFAQGDRDDLGSDHGKTYCAYLLIKRYMEDGVVLSRYTDAPDIFSEIEKSSPKPSGQKD